MPTSPGCRASTTTPTSWRTARGSPPGRPRSRSWRPGSRRSSPGVDTRCGSRSWPRSTAQRSGRMFRLADVDPDIAKALREEAQRQHRNLELIASENFVSEAVLEAMGSVLTNKYAEGYPGRRYYGGCEVVDVVEDRDVAKKHRPKLIIAGGSAFPRAIDFRPFGEIAREVGASLMADIAHPAGLVAAGLHPSPVGIADFVTTTTHKTLRGPRGGMVMCRTEHAQALDKTVMPGVQGGPLMHVIAAKAVAFKEALRPAWREYQKQIVKNAKALADALLARGFRLVSGGTDTHLILVDLTNRGITGKEAQEGLDRAWITVNKNTIPFETKSPMVTSGIRLGTPAVTTRGMREPEMVEIAGLIDRVLSKPATASVEASVRDHVQELTNRFPLYTERRA